MAGFEFSYQLVINSAASVAVPWRVVKVAARPILRFPKAGFSRSQRRGFKCQKFALQAVKTSRSLPDGADPIDKPTQQGEPLDAF